MFVLQNTSLTADSSFKYVQFLQEISAEQQFEVTYVDVEERARSGELLCSNFKQDQKKKKKMKLQCSYGFTCISIVTTISPLLAAVRQVEYGEQHCNFNFLWFFLNETLKEVYHFIIIKFISLVVYYFFYMPDI